VVNFFQHSLIFGTILGLNCCNRSKLVRFKEKNAFIKNLA
jgi:hypothetical protein